MSQILGPLITQLWWVIPLLIVGAIVKTPWFKGVLGEWIIQLSSKYLLDQDVYHALHDVTLNTSDGTTQIDHIFVSRFGVFVVETKNFSGWIFGDAKQAMWTQQIYKAKNRFQNPLHQNYKHLKAIEELLAISADKMFSVIVFVGSSEFKTTVPDNVTQSGGFIRYIKSKTQVLLSDAEVLEIVRAIEGGRLRKSLATTRQHVADLKQRMDLDAQNSVQKICPKCGSALVLRTVKSGDKAGQHFLGCSRFPKCRTMISTV